MKKCNEMISIYFKEYTHYNKILSEKIKSEKNENNFQKLIDNKELAISFIMFSHIKNNIDEISFEFNINQNHNFLLNFMKNQIKDYRYDLLYYWQHYLIISFIEELKILLTKRIYFIKILIFFQIFIKIK